ncbi:MAG: restriction endonuclease [Selenomonadaceae bacterium]|nr:restriction endonuclease [Selenomonadaceae bacterium]
MNINWQETEKGYLYPKNEQLATATRAKLEMLCLDNVAKEQPDGTLIPFEKAVTFSAEDADLLGFPPHNPYRISIRTSGDLAHANLKYILEVLQPDGRPFVRPKINGAILHIDSETTYRLNSDQYQLVQITQESNAHVSQLSRREVLEYILTNTYHIQKHAKATSAKLDNMLSEKNTKIVVADKLDVEFKDVDDDKVKVEPILLMKGNNGELTEIDEQSLQDFQDVFNDRKNRNNVRNVYQGKDRVRYVCNAPLQKGLQEIKAVGTISKNDAARYAKQPRELFTEEVFDFTRENRNISFTEKPTGTRKIEGKTNAEQNVETEDWLPSEGDTDDNRYSSRVIGVEEVKKSLYMGRSGHQTDWLGVEGDLVNTGNAMQDNAPSALTSETNIPATDTNQEVPGDSNEKINEKETEPTNDDTLKSTETEDAPDVKPPIASAKMYALKIKPNIERIDYVRQKEARHGSFSALALSSGVKLLPHQEKGVEWMLTQWEDGCQGVLLADDMGLGKTLQTLAFIAGLRKSCPGYHQINNPVLIVAPTALLANWHQEYETFIQKGVFSQIIHLTGVALRSFQTGQLTPNGKKKLQLALPKDAIALTTYETLRDYQFSFAEVSWSIIIADEAQKFKNPQIGITLALKAMKYDFTVCLSGTPVENSWLDLWSIMDFVQPAYLGELRTFKEKYIDKLSKIGEDNKQIELLGKQLQRDLDPLFLRRMKKDHLTGLPKKNVYKCPTEMPEYQKQRYLTILYNSRQNDVHPLQVIARLRDVSLHPDLGIKPVNILCDMPTDTIINQSARLKKTFAILGEVKARDEKALIFLVSRNMQLVLVHLIAEKFDISVLPPINGSMNGEARQRIVDKFNNSIGFGVLVLSPEAAGVGFTITAANNVIHLSRTWNPAKEDQATDRVYRIGQQRTVNVYLPLACHRDLGKGGSFDEKLDELLSYKRTLSENVLFPTSDSSKDGLKLYRDLTGTDDSNRDVCYWQIDDIDTIIPRVFEEIITELYNAMDNYTAEKTPLVNDNGADVVAINNRDKTGLLLQCKHVEMPEKSVGKRGIQEIVAAMKPYGENYKGIALKPVVITNAHKFSPGANELAAQNNVKLVTRDELARLLNTYHVPKAF